MIAPLQSPGNLAAQATLLTAGAVGSPGAAVVPLLGFVFGRSLPDLPTIAGGGAMAYGTRLTPGAIKEN